MRIPIEIAGKSLDYTEAGVGLPVVHVRVASIFIDKAKVGNAKVFRPDRWKGVLIVSGEIKDALERMGATGTRFEEV